MSASAGAGSLASSGTHVRSTPTVLPGPRPRWKITSAVAIHHDHFIEAFLDGWRLEQTEHAPNGKLGHDFVSRTLSVLYQGPRKRCVDPDCGRSNAKALGESNRTHSMSFRG